MSSNETCQSQKAFKQNAGGKSQPDYEEFEMNMEDHNNIIVLFDEHATPVFGPSRQKDYFVGVGVTYNLQDEKQIFSACESLFGLGNAKPLKNQRIGTSRAVEISKLLIKLPIQIVISKLDLTDKNFEDKVNVYEELGDFMRSIHRDVSGRPLAQILHSRILDPALFESISRYLEYVPKNSIFEIYIDNWSFPESDKEMILQDTSKSLEEKITELHNAFFPNISITARSLELLVVDTSRKRFVDVVTSVVSRAIPLNSKISSEEPLNIILSNPQNVEKDFTQETMDTLQVVMDDVSRDTENMAFNYFSKFDQVN